MQVRWAVVSHWPGTILLYVPGVRRGRARRCAVRPLLLATPQTKKTEVVLQDRQGKKSMLQADEPDFYQIEDHPQGRISREISPGKCPLSLGD
jgi:hypothetical protein